MTTQVYVLIHVSNGTAASLGVFAKEDDAITRQNEVRAELDAISLKRGLPLSEDELLIEPDYIH